MMNTRALAKKAVKEQILSASLQRFNQCGFEQTTIEDIASDIGMSARTFFRYFRFKDDLLLEPTRMFNVSFLNALQEHLTSDDIWVALTASLVASVTNCEKQEISNAAYSVQQMIENTPTLLAKQLELSEQLQVDATEVCMRESEQAIALGWSTTNAIIRVAFACMRATHYQFARNIQSNEAVDELRRLLSNLRPVVLK